MLSLDATYQGQQDDTAPEIPVTVTLCTYREGCIYTNIYIYIYPNEHKRRTAGAGCASLLAYTHGYEACCTALTSSAKCAEQVVILPTSPHTPLTHSDNHSARQFIIKYVCRLDPYNLQRSRKDHSESRC